MVTVGKALGEIRDRRLYLYHRKGYKTWDTYCRAEWDWGSNYANKLIATSRCDSGTMVPSERVGRELVRLPVEMQRAVLRRAHERYGPKLTAKQVRQARQELGTEPDGRVLPEVARDLGELWGR